MKLIARFWKSIAAVCAGLVILSGGIVAYDEIRPYPTRTEFKQVAGRSCKNEMSFLTTELRTINREIVQAQNQGNANWERSLQEQKLAVLAEIERVKRECGWS